MTPVADITQNQIGVEIEKIQIAIKKNEKSQLLWRRNDASFRKRLVIL